MQIFKYNWKTGKGECVANLRYSGLSHRIGETGRYMIHAQFSTIRYNDENEPVWDTWTADDFDCEAVCFCKGQWDGVWEWVIVPNKVMTEKAHARNMRLYGTVYVQKIK